MKAIPCTAALRLHPGNAIDLLACVVVLDRVALGDAVVHRVPSTFTRLDDAHD